VTIYNDICGKFEDYLVSYINGLQPNRIPVRVKVKGSPLIVAPHQLGINYRIEPPVLSMGSLPSSEDSHKKTLRLFNTGPKPIALQWKVFNYDDLDDR